MPSMITPEQLAERVCRALNIPAKDNVESLTEILRTALSETRDRAIGAAKAVCLEIAEDEAERCRGVGATTAQQTALTIAARIRSFTVRQRISTCSDSAVRRSTKSRAAFEISARQRRMMALRSTSLASKRSASRRTSSTKV